MANGKTNVGLFERAGRAAAGGSGGYIDYAKIGREVDDAARKTANLLKENPNGVEIPKITDPVSEKVAAWLSGKKDEIGRMHDQMRNGSDEEKKEAVEYLNNIDKGVKQLNDDFEGAAAKRADYLAIEQKGTYAVANSGEQAKNFHKFANGDFANEGEIIEDENGFPRLNYGGQIWNTIDVGNEYNFELEDTVDNLLTETEDLAIKGKPWNRDATRRNLEKIARDPKAVKEYMFQNEELMDAYISRQTGIPQTIDNEQNPKWKEFKDNIVNAKGNLSTMPRIGDTSTKESKMMYDDYFNANKTDANFGSDFVDLVMETFQNKYDNPPKSSDQVDTSNMTDEELQEYYK